MEYNSHSGLALALVEHGANVTLFGPPTPRASSLMTHFCLLFLQPDCLTQHGNLVAVVQFASAFGKVTSQFKLEDSMGQIHIF